MIYSLWVYYYFSLFKIFSAHCYMFGPLKCMLSQSMSYMETKRQVICIFLSFYILSRFLSIIPFLMRILDSFHPILLGMEELVPQQISIDSMKKYKPWKKVSKVPPYLNCSFPYLTSCQLNHITSTTCD